MHTALQIPQLGDPRHCPRSFTVPDAGEPLTARTAIALIDAGLIADSNKPATPADAIRAGLDAWLADQQVDMHVFRFGLQVAQVDMTTRATRGEPNQQHFNVRLTTHDGMWPAGLFIGAAVTRLEREYKGLGESILYWIRHASRLVPIFTPHDALGMASFVYWSGCDDESEWIDMLKDGGEDPDDFEYLTRAEFDKAVPRWASMPDQSLSERALRQIVNRQLARTRAARVAMLILQLIDHDKTTGWPDPLPLPNDERFDTILRAAALRWKDTDPLLRIVDDFGNMAMESGEFIEHFSEMKIAAVHPGTSSEERTAIIGDWRAHFDHLARVMDVLRIIDALIVEISSPAGLRELQRSHTR